MSEPKVTDESKSWLKVYKYEFITESKTQIQFAGPGLTTATQSSLIPRHTI